MTPDDIEQMRKDMEAAQTGEVLARRIARVPQLEAEVLRLREALRSIDNMDPRLGNNGNRNDLIAVAAVQIANHALKGTDQ